MTAEQNKQIARRFVEEVWGNGDLDAAREIVDPYVVHHRQRSGEPFGVEGLLQGLEMYNEAYPERTFQQRSVIVDGDWVADRWTMSAIHSGELLGVPPTGRRISLEGMNRYLIEDGKIVEIWHDEDIYGMMTQLGWEPPVRPGWPPRRRETYRLAGAQVEPDASFWTAEPCPVPSVVRVSDLLLRTDDAGDPWYLPPYPDDRRTDLELDELVELAALRDDPNAVAGGDGPKRRLPLSPLLQLRPPPLGAVYNRLRGDDEPLIRTGRELARWFENETPGLSHRHAANYLLHETGWSPPRQARLWAALDVAIYSATAAAWHYKWRSNRQRVRFRPRPAEVDYRVSVLYHRAVDSTGAGDGRGRQTPVPSPGTPRHPAYPAGHSAVGGAATELLSYFFPDYAGELDQLADNCGMARLWAGIHYRSDHTAGLALGRAVGRLVIAQLTAGGVPPEAPPMPERIPTPEELEARAQELSRSCASGAPAATSAMPG